MVRPYPDRLFGGDGGTRIVRSVGELFGIGERMLNGLRTAIYHARDLEAAKGWYADVLGIRPYFDEPFYVGFDVGGFDVGGFELGLQPDGSTSRRNTGVIAYWGVDDAEAALARLLELGARGHGGVQDVGGGIRVATVLDQFGSVFGVNENPHFSLGDA
jgi:predicted enzyme related to lactoylglutathione lyase